MSGEAWFRVVFGKLIAMPFLRAFTFPICFEFVESVRFPHLQFFYFDVVYVCVCCMARELTGFDHSASVCCHSGGARDITAA